MPGATPGAVSRGGAIAPRAHLIGIAGSGMRSLAQVLREGGWHVTGSDLRPGRPGMWQRLGIPVTLGHRPEHVAGPTGVVIHSDAVPPDNPELGEARRRGLPVLSYFQTLGRLMSGKRGLAVAGTHGKSTTTAMAAHILIRSGRDPTVLLGATPMGWPTGGRRGEGDLVLVEACEYRENFLHLAPQVAVVHRIEPDHFDYYPTLGRLVEAFVRFVVRLPPDGLLLVRHECPTARRIAAFGAGWPRAIEGPGVRPPRCRMETFGLDRRADWSAAGTEFRGGQWRFSLVRRGEHLGDVRLAMAGKHNVVNAVAAAALSCQNGVPPAEVIRGLESFPGVHRRLERVGRWRGATLVDDYAHHPTEVAASLAALRQRFPGRRLWCLFQPHQVSRTVRLLDGFAASLQNADKILLGEIYRAREPARCGQEMAVTELANRVRGLGGQVAGVHRGDCLRDHLERNVRPRDVLVTMGAGDIREIITDRSDG